MIQTQSQNEEIRQIGGKVYYKARRKVWSEVWYKVWWSLKHEVRSEVWRKLFR